MNLLKPVLLYPRLVIARFSKASQVGGYNNTGLSKLMERGIFRKLGEGYPRQLAQLLHKPY
jgi:hypothetical protein